MANSILQVENLVKRYGDVEAVRGVSFSVEEGEVFGLLGPNGAGKTSTVEILEGLRTPDGGRVSVCGLDPQRDSVALKHEIGAALQSTSLPDKLRVIEALRLFSSFYKRGRKPDELQVRREIYDIIEELKREKKTIVMTTHYIEEAERLCDRVAIVDHGKVIALGTPRDLKAHSGGTTRIEVRLSKPASNGTLKSLDGAVDAREVGGTYVIHSQRPPQTIVALVKHLEAEGNELVSLEIASPSLEDVFIEMTGRRLRD